MNYRLTFLGVLALLALVLELGFAGEYFERDGAAIDGHDPVAYFTEQKPVKGSPAFRVEFEGATFQFASAAHRVAFVADPSKFVPQYGGYCAYGMARGYKAKIDPAAFTVVSNKLYLNYSAPVSDPVLALMRWIDELYLQYPFAGARMLRDLLRQEGHAIGRRRVATLMRRMGITAVYRTPCTTQRHPAHRIYPYFLRGLDIARPRHLPSNGSVNSWRHEAAIHGVHY